MGDRRCWVCGAHGAKILCPKCRNTICSDCYDYKTHLCAKCLDEGVSKGSERSRIMLFGGLFLLILGLSLAAASLIYGLPYEGVTIVAPFIIGEVSPWMAGLYSLLFFLTLGCASLLPWYIHERRGGIYGEDLDLVVQEGEMTFGEGFERIEYVITAKLPKKLENGIIVESYGASVNVQSATDEEFSRSYRIPDGHDIEGFDYDYEDGYLVIRLRLVRIP